MADALEDAPAVPVVPRVLDAGSHELEDGNDEGSEADGAKGIGRGPEERVPDRGGAEGRGLEGGVPEGPDDAGHGGADDALDGLVGPVEGEQEE